MIDTLHIMFYAGFGLAGIGGIMAALRLFKGKENLRVLEGGFLVLGVLLHTLIGLLTLNDPMFLTLYLLVGLTAITLVARSFSAKLIGPSFWITVGAVVLMTGYEILLWVNLGRPPFQFLGETFVWLSLITGVLLIITERLQNIPGLGQFAGIVMIASLAFSAVWPDLQTKELPPALQSAWFVPHVLVYLLGYGALTLAFVSAVGYLIAERTHSKRARMLGDTSYKLVSLGFPFLTAGLVFGAFWGQKAWGAYWGWDPKENWALVTWLVYVLYLHMRYIKNWNRSRAAWVLIAGVAVIFITYLAVNALPTAQQSVHTYTG